MFATGCFLINYGDTSLYFRHYLICYVSDITEVVGNGIRLLMAFLMDSKLLNGNNTIIVPSSAGCTFRIFANGHLLRFIRVFLMRTRSPFCTYRPFASVLQFG